ncbi:MAG: FecR domain-containing protein [Eubacteriales bacterium]
MKKTKLLSLFLALGLILSGCSNEDSSESPSASASASNSSDSGSIFGNVFGGSDNSTTADEMRLENYTGSITLQNNSEEKAVVLGSRLVTGDNIETMVESNAYVVLDSSKVLRVNETSQVEIVQEDKQLDIHLSKGTVFFNVTSSLSAEESLEFHTNNVVTGVRGTSGIIHFDPVAQITQIVVLTGIVTGTTASEEQNIEAGQVAIVETLADGTVEMAIYGLEEEDPIYYFSDTFVDGIQGDLNGEGQSLSLSELVRMPEGVNLPSNIQVLGNSRSLTPEQATAYADYLNNSQATHVAFVDSGNNSVVMIAGTLEGYPVYSTDGFLEGTENYILPTVVGWTETELVTNQFTLQQYDGNYIKENDGEFYLQSQKSAYDTGIGVTGYQDFSFSDRMFSQKPDRMYLYVYVMWENSASSYVNRYAKYVLPEDEISNFITDSELEALANFTDSAALSTTFELKDGTYTEATTFVEEVALDFEDVDSPYWNSVEDVLAALES